MFGSRAQATAVGKSRQVCFPKQAGCIESSLQRHGPLPSDDACNARHSCLVSWQSVSDEGLVRANNEHDNGLRFSTACRGTAKLRRRSLGHGHLIPNYALLMMFPQSNTLTAFCPASCVCWVSADEDLRLGLAIDATCNQPASALAPCPQFWGEGDWRLRQSRATCQIPHASGSEIAR